ncbi:MAG TPA: VOC family protein [Candidatus Limnocylindria bacterium]|nr:VOC family protein [Candidatus Limnocylindria bacterium]
MSLGIVLDCADPEQLAGFWARALRYRVGPYQPPYIILRPEAGDGPKFVLQHVPEPKQVKNRMHLDLWVADIEVEARRLSELGARRQSADPLEEIGSRWIVMADPEGNEFCLCQEAKSPPAAATR